MTWRVRRTDVEFFREDLWKDLRPFPRAPSEGVFAKDCFEPAAAFFEAAVILHLRNRLGPIAPRPIEIVESVLVMERVRGARLFDLIRHLRAVEYERRDGRAQEALDILMSRARSRLAAIQVELFDVRGVLAQESYPLGSKLRSLLSLFVRVLDIRRQPAGWEKSLEDFGDYWESECVFIPFRDATTKNMIVSEPRLAAESGAEDSEGAQRASAALLVENEDLAFWTRVPLVDIDFSSIKHLTSPEDDPISLHCHEWTIGTCEISSAAFILDGRFGKPTEERTAASFLVRYLRFGGRKLAYRLINSQGFKVRFAYDDPLFYFDRLPQICRDLSPEFADEYRPLFEIIQLINDVAGNPSPKDAALMSVDHLRRFYPSVQYWQQNPLDP